VRSLRRTVLGPLAVAVATAAMLPVRGALGVVNVLLAYLLVVFALALGLGAGPAALAAVLSFLALNFFFIPPFHTFEVARGGHVLALFVYLGVAVVTGQLVARVRARTEEAARVSALARSDELKSALLAAVSHELRTPLATIKATTASLLDPAVTWTEADRAEFLRAVDAETDRLTLMVNNLLDLSRIEGGALQPDKEWYDAAELVADVVRRLARRAAAHPLAAEVQPDLPLARFDYVEIAQVLTNLVENAIAHTPPGTPVTISARRVAGAIEFAVRDRGPGIAPRHLGRLFDKFYRASDGRAGAGTGIGLTISKGLVEAHGGRIWVESQVGVGTAFRFTVPAPTDDGGAERGRPG
jgi:two-component system sensor histidine kinase KdpD